MDIEVPGPCEQVVEVVLGATPVSVVSDGDIFITGGPGKKLCSGRKGGKCQCIRARVIFFNHTPTQRNLLPKILG